jgi:hypothetical protein
MISHLISTIAYHEVQRVPLSLPPRPPSSGYRRTPRDMQTFVPDHAGSLPAVAESPAAKVPPQARPKGKPVDKHESRRRHAKAAPS